ncbi:GTP pyrophosphokinase [Lactococcus cremoris subsp. cremoris UC509.9]|nr:GTP pyrophosphokinase [Lactococcus cremoris subsp. cremoris UC509.9]QRZ29193.1 GTP pyrophosphokinase [Lactococcus cremoris]
MLLQGEKMFNWEEFLDPYVQTVGELKIKFRGVRKQYLKKGLYSPIEFVTGRVKRRESIRNKAKLRGSTRENLSEMEDIAGVRVMVQFVDDVWDVLELLRKRKDFKIIEERDYINNQKASGYRSYHVIIEYPIDTIDGFQIVNAEIQIRTLAMNFWATIEHSLNYKYGGLIPEDVKARLTNAAREAAQLDSEMGEIREDIQEAQLLFDSPQQKQDFKKENGEENELW